MVLAWQATGLRTDRRLALESGHNKVGQPVFNQRPM